MKYPWGDEAPEGRACFDLGGINGRPVRVGGYEPNLYGLFDMAGNVSEWCSDWYGRDYYQNSPSRNPAGPPSADARVLRGGNWSNGGGTFLRSSCRSLGGQLYRFPYFGFRCVRSVR
jgi:formylglycine-generating enzyme